MLWKKTKKTSAVYLLSPHWNCEILWHTDARCCFQVGETFSALWSVALVCLEMVARDTHKRALTVTVICLPLLAGVVDSIVCNTWLAFVRLLYGYFWEYVIVTLVSVIKLDVFLFANIHLADREWWVRVWSLSHDHCQEPPIGQNYELGVPVAYESPEGTCLSGINVYTLWLVKHNLLFCSHKQTE